MDIVAYKRRRAIMMGANTVSVLAALAAAVGYFKFEIAWALFAFVGALVLGFGAQIWFIAGLRRKGV